MTKPLAQINLQKQAGQFKKSIGYHFGKDRDGNTVRTERVWWLGSDEREAEQKAVILLAQWRKIKARGGEIWTQEDIDAVDAFLFPATKRSPFDQAERRRTVEDGEEYEVPFVEGVNGTPRARFSSPLIELTHSADQLGFRLVPKFAPTKPGLNLHAAIDLYVENLESKPNIAPSNLDRQRRDMADLKTVWSDRPLKDMGFDEVQKIVNHFLSRPASPNTGKKLAVATVVTMLSHTRQMLTWLDDCGRWESPRKFEKIFRFKKRSIMTPAEERRAQAGPTAFTVPELATLWANANERQRCLMGAALFTGMTQWELSILERAEIAKIGGRVVIDHVRGKTGIRGRYIIPEPVATSVKAGMETSGELAFRTAEGKPLVWYSETGQKTDSVAQMWRRLLKNCPKVRPLGFKFLRKTGATMICDLTGSDRLAELYLSHSGQSVAKKNYLARTDATFAQLADALARLRQALEPVFDGSAVIKDDSKKAG